jgi:predicted PurR-regulated permease PerM
VYDKFSRRRKAADAAIMTLSAGGVVAVLFLLYSLRQVALLAYAAVLAAVIFSALANALSRRLPLPRGLVVVLVPIALIGIIAAVMALVGSEASAQFRDLRDRIPEMVDTIEGLLPNNSIERTLRENLPGSEVIAGWVAGLASLLTSAVTGIVLGLLGGIYLASNPESYRRGLAALFTSHAHADVYDILIKLYTGLKNWLLGQLASMVIVGTLVYIGLTVLGVPGAVALALLAGLLEFIPLIGPFIAAIPPILAALTVSPQLALYTAGFFVVLQQIEGNLLAPIIMKHAVSIPPAITLLSLLMIGTLFGPLGVILGGPLTVAGFIAVRELWVIRIMGHDEDESEMPEETP